MTSPVNRHRLMSSVWPRNCSKKICCWSQATQRRHGKPVKRGSNRSRRTKLLSSTFTGTWETYWLSIHLCRGSRKLPGKNQRRSNFVNSLPENEEDKSGMTPPLLSCIVLAFTRNRYCGSQ